MKDSLFYEKRFLTMSKHLSRSNGKKDNDLIEEYLNKPDKYLYTLVYSNNDIAYRNFQTSIQKVIQANKNFFIHSSSLVDIKFVVYQRKEVIPPSKYEIFDSSKIFSLLEDADRQKNQRYAMYSSSKVFSRLSYKNIKELTKIINDYLDNKIDYTDNYEVGEFVTEISLSKSECLQYLID